MGCGKQLCVFQPGQVQAGQEHAGDGVKAEGSHSRYPGVGLEITSDRYTHMLSCHVSVSCLCTVEKQWEVI